MCHTCQPPQNWRSRNLRDPEGSGSKVSDYEMSDCEEPTSQFMIRDKCAGRTFPLQYWQLYPDIYYPKVDAVLGWWRNDSPIAPEDIWYHGLLAPKRLGAIDYWQYRHLLPLIACTTDLRYHGLKKYGSLVQRTIGPAYMFSTTDCSHHALLVTICLGNISYLGNMAVILVA